MKISEKWLREWVNPKLKREALCDALTMAGFEVEELAPVAGEISNVVTAEILNVKKHPEADRLSICEVSTGSKTYTIVCGDPKVQAGMKVALSRTEPKTIRGVTSQGMLASAAELGLSDDNSGIYQLEPNAKLGMSLTKYLDLDDYTITVAIMPNRGDCLSIKGMAREVSAITHTPFKELKIKPVKPSIKQKLSIKITDKKGCPHYVGRVIRNVKANISSPIWLQERLRRVGARSISPVVDVTNYVMFELGQPMHAFDLNKIQGGIEVKSAKNNEKIKLLDDSEKTLQNHTMVIADAKQPLAIAGVMGGVDSSVTEDTTDIFLESAFFSPQTIAKQRQFYNLNSDSAYRFERGVDPELQNQAIERATQLILEICGGEAGPVTEVSIKATLPKQQTVTLTSEKVERVLGILVPAKAINTIFKGLHLNAKQKGNKWQVQIPSFRSDISLPEDLIEEIARLYGLDKIPERRLHAELARHRKVEQSEDYQHLRQSLADHGYHEIVSYSFIDKKSQQLFDPMQTPQDLVNPITNDMTVMRTNLWPGLVNTMLYNQARQQNRVRLFEIGTCFINGKAGLQHIPRLAGLISGSAQVEQWGQQTRDVDFFDLKGDLESLLTPICGRDNLDFSIVTHPSLHPGKSAKITYKGKEIGIIGVLHPNITQSLDINSPVLVFELDIASIASVKAESFKEISKFPEIRRDIAILVDEAVPSKVIQDTIRKTAGDWLNDVFIFDVYQGKGVSPGQKSIALALVIQHPTRTLVDEEVASLMQRVIAALKGNLGAELRS